MLERLAATEDMFKQPVSTIRDVAELTDASPNLIARMLGEIRGPDEFEKLQSKMAAYDVRLRDVERKVNAPSGTANPSHTGRARSAKPEEVCQFLDLVNEAFNPPSNIVGQGLQEGHQQQARKYEIGAGLIVVVVLLSICAVRSMNTDEIVARRPAFTTKLNGAQFTVYDDYSVSKDSGSGADTPTKEEIAQVRAQYRRQKDASKTK